MNTTASSTPSVTIGNVPTYGEYNKDTLFSPEGISRLVDGWLFVEGRLYGHPNKHYGLDITAISPEDIERFKRPDEFSLMMAKLLDKTPNIRSSVVLAFGLRDNVVHDLIEVAVLLSRTVGVVKISLTRARQAMASHIYTVLAQERKAILAEEQRVLNEMASAAGPVSLNSRIEDLGLWAQTYRALQNMGLTTVSEVLQAMGDTEWPWPKSTSFERIRMNLCVVLMGHEAIRPTLLEIGFW